MVWQSSLNVLEETVSGYLPGLGSQGHRKVLSTNRVFDDFWEIRKTFDVDVLNASGNRTFENGW